MADTTVAPAPSTTTPRNRRRIPLAMLLERYTLPVLLVVLVAFFTLNATSSVAFTSESNIQNIFSNQSVTGLIALGMIVPLIAGYFDLSVAAIAGISSVTVAAVSGTHGQPIFIGILAAIGIAVVGGAINGLLVAVLKLNPFVTTLGTYILFGGLLALYTKGATIGTGLPLSFGEWGATTLLGISSAFWLLIVVAAVVWYVITQTPYGRKLAAIGSNESAGRLAGFRVDRAVFLAFLASALLAGIAGVVLTSRTLGADATAAQSYLFPALAAVFLGQTAISPGHYNVWGTMIAVFFIAVAINGFTLMGAAFWVTPVFNGAALVVAVALSTFIARAGERRARAELAHATLDHH